MSGTWCKSKMGEKINAPMLKLVNKTDLKSVVRLRLVGSNPIRSNTCPSGEIRRHGRLRIYCFMREGASPFLGKFVSMAKLVNAIASKAIFERIVSSTLTRNRNKGK